ncbi:MAG: ATP-binding protein [Anaerolineae bacterium]|nr:AAA family ATPase [Anaerolineales bacterium]MCQ3976734.1 ATP-dependent protease [Anaerolineae bacterium]
MSAIKPLQPAMLRRHCDPESFSFETTAELEELTEIVGQARAVEAVRFGIDIRREGYNLFVLGPPGIGKHSLVRQFLEQEVGAKPTPADWCYVNNFEQPHKPHVLRLPPGQGQTLCQDMSQLVEELRTTIPAVFDSEDYRTRKQGLEEEFKEREEKAFAELKRRATEHGFALMKTPVGLAFAPVQDGHVLTPEQFDKLSATEQERITTKLTELQEQLQTTIQQGPRWEREFRERLKALNHEITLLAVGHLVDELREKYVELPEVVNYLNAVQQDIVENTDDFRPAEEPSPAAALGFSLPGPVKDSSPFRRYQVNLLVDNSATQGTPVIYEDHPTHQNLVGKVEHLVTQMGALTTDFTLIRPGALHRANGGYLVLDAHKVLLQPYAWEQLKRALRSGEIRIESLQQIFGLISTVSLEPEPIPLQVKIVLVGERLLYYLLYTYDPDFAELFKVEADFEEQMERTPENDLLYARLVGALARKEGLRHFDRTAVAQVIERSARLAGDAEKLSTHMQSIADLLREADYWAGQAGRPVVSAGDVQQAIEAQIYRADRLRQRIQEEMQRETILIDTQGEKVGQINGLSVMTLGSYAFGRPSRITARVWLGKGQVVDIEREVELGGPIHSKGVLILSGFLGARYALERPLSLSASLVFEQSYSGVEGDSASSAELYALLSALAEAPLKQSLAVTGSVNQHGQVQAIGGVNEKIEGFFDLCRARGLTGTQGVLIPAANVKHLMLRQDVVEAAAAGKFQIYPVETIDQGIEILTGLPAGERDEAGNYPEGSLNQRVETRLAALADKWRAFSAPPEAKQKGQP